MKHLAFAGLIVLLAIVIVPMFYLHIDLANWPFGPNEDVLVIWFILGCILMLLIIIAAGALVFAWCKAVIWCWEKLNS